MSDSLWDTLKKALSSSEEKDSAASDAVASSPPPPPAASPPVLTQRADEPDLAFAMRRRKASNAWKRKQRDAEASPASPPAESTDSEPEDRRTTVQKAYSRSEEELEKLGEK